MSGRMGFFTRSEARAAAFKKKSTKTSEMPLDVIRKMGVRAVEGMNPKAKNPNMAPAGADRPSLYVLGEAPGAAEDRVGIPFFGKEGNDVGEAVKDIVEYVDVPARYSHIVRTAIPKHAKPEDYHIEAFRSLTVEDIERSKPKIILAVGWAATRWCLPDLPRGGKFPSDVARGRLFPTRIGNHPVWVFPVHHPAFLFKIERDRHEKIPGREWMKTFRKDVEEAAKLSRKISKPNLSALDEDYRGMIEVVRSSDDFDRFVEYAKSFDGKRVGLDYETTTVRPYGGASRVLSLSIGDASRAFSILVDHPDQPWSRSRRKKLEKVFHSTLSNASSVLAHNALFEVEWTLGLLNDEKLVRGIIWDDSMTQAYVLDGRSGGLSLEYCSEQRLGVPVKGIMGLDRKRLDEAPIPDLLTYNGIDVVFADRIFEIQSRLLEDAGLDSVYEFHRTRIPTLGISMFRGIPVSQKIRKELVAELTPDLKKSLKKLRSSPGVKKFELKKGTYNPGSGKDNLILFRDILDREEGEKPNGDYSLDEKSLKSMRGCEEAKHLLDYRTKSKIVSTYLDPFDPENPKTAVWPDGKIHTSYKHLFTKSTRLSSENPNNQNWPKRDKSKKVVRKQIKPKKGYKLLSADYGQIEARMIGMASKDKAFCKALWDDYDIHREWAERVAKEYPPAFKKFGNSDMKTFRGVIKNTMVFPAFFRSSERSIGRSLEIPEKPLRKLFRKFWSTFSGVREWQEGLLEEYARFGYVTAINGRRYFGPLSENQIVNLPIQGPSSDIVVDAMDRLSFTAAEEDRPELHPVLNIHDDLTFIYPEYKEEDTIVSVIEHMVDVDFDFINVPISIECEVGFDWFNMEEIGIFSSKEL